MKPPSTWPRSIAGLSERAGVVQHVRREQLPFAGEGVDDDLAHRRAVGEVEERPALHRVLVPRQAGGGVEAVGPELHPRHVGLDHQLAKAHRLRRADAHRAVGEAHVGGGHRVALGGEGGEPIADLPRRVLRRLAVEVAAGRGGGGRGVGDLVRVGGGRAHHLEVDAELVRHHLRDLGVEALAHLGAAVVHQHRAVAVHVHQRAGLVEVDEVERDAELHRREGEAALEDLAAGVEGGDLLRAAPGSRWSPRARRRARG